MKFTGQLSKTKVLMFPIMRRIEITDIKNIVRIEVIDGNSLVCFTNGQRLLSSKILKWFQAQLPADLFMQVHRRHLVNKKFMWKYNKQNRMIILSNGESVAISQRKKAEFLRLLNAA